MSNFVISVRSLRRAAEYLAHAQAMIERWQIAAANAEARLANLEADADPADVLWVRADIAAHPEIDPATVAEGS